MDGLAHHAGGRGCGVEQDQVGCGQTDWPCQGIVVLVVFSLGIGAVGQKQQKFAADQIAWDLDIFGNRIAASWREWSCVVYPLFVDARVTDVIGVIVRNIDQIPPVGRSGGTSLVGDRPGNGDQFAGQGGSRNHRIRHYEVRPQNFKRRRQQIVGPVRLQFLLAPIRDEQQVLVPKGCFRHRYADGLRVAGAWCQGSMVRRRFRGKQRVEAAERVVRG